MEKYTTEPKKVHLNKNTGNLKTTLTAILKFEKMPTSKKNRYSLFMFERKKFYY